MINSWADARSFVVRLCANFVQLHSATNTQHTHVFAQFGVWFASHHIIIPTAARNSRRKNKSQRSGNHQTVDHGIVLCLIMRASGREVCAHFMRAYAYVYVCLCVTRVKRENFNLSFYGPHRKYRHRRRILSEKGSKSEIVANARSTSIIMQHTDFRLENPTVGEIGIELFKLNQCLLWLRAI